MCWNKEVSLNTFLFSMGVLGMIWYNNTYTKYIIPEFDRIWVYIFFISFITIQLIEFFIWTNIHRPWYNSFFSILASVLLLIQPIATTMLISDQTVKHILLGTYLSLAIPFSTYRFITKKISSSVSKGGHLQWDFLLKRGWYEHAIFLLWLFFFLFPFFYMKKFWAGLFGLVLLIVMAYNYFVDGTMGSMWCWIVNLIMIYYAAYILIYLPFILG